MEPLTHRNVSADFTSKGTKGQMEGGRHWRGGKRKIDGEDQPRRRDTQVKGDHANRPDPAGRAPMEGEFRGRQLEDGELQDRLHGRVLDKLDGRAGEGKISWSLVGKIASFLPRRRNGREHGTPGFEDREGREAGEGRCH